jgi:hypothetical protein
MQYQKNLAIKFKAMLTKNFPNPRFFGYALPVTSTTTVHVFLQPLSTKLDNSDKGHHQQLNGWANINSLLEQKLMCSVVVTTNHYTACT